MLRNLSFVVALTLISAGSAAAQDPLLAQLYGSGVHAFFSGDYKQARDNFSAAIDGGSQDPRVYYFRALAEMRSGQDPSADFEKGAELEGADSSQSYAVSKAIERIQGSTRATLEKYRLKARVAAHQNKEGQRQAVYQQRRDADTQVLRQAGPPPSAATLEPAPSTGPAPLTGPADTSLFGEAPKMTHIDKAGPAGGAAGTPTPGAGGAVEDPFANSAQGPPSGADPFANAAPATAPPTQPATPPQEPVVEKPAAPATPPPAGEADPFAEPPAGK